MRVPNVETDEFARVQQDVDLRAGDAQQVAYFRRREAGACPRAR